MNIGIVGGDGKRTPPLIEYIGEQLGALTTWHITARSNPKSLRSPADLIIVLVDYCGHPLYMAAKTHAEKIGAAFVTASIQRSKTQEVLDVLKTNTNRVQRLLANKYQYEFMTQKQILREYLIGVSTLLNYCESKLLVPSVEAIALGSPAKLFARPAVDSLLKAKGHSLRFPAPPVTVAAPDPLPRAKMEELSKYLFVDATGAQMVPAKEAEEPPVPEVAAVPTAPTAPAAPAAAPQAATTYLLLRRQSVDAFTTVTTLDTLEGVSALVEADMEKSSTASSGEYTVVEIRKTFKARRAITITED